MKKLSLVALLALGALGSVSTIQANDLKLVVILEQLQIIFGEV